MQVLDELIVGRMSNCLVSCSYCCRQYEICTILMYWDFTVNIATKKEELSDERRTNVEYITINFILPFFEYIFVLYVPKMV